MRSGQRLKMNFIDLTLALVITSNVIISCQSATTHFCKRTEVHPHKLNLSERKNVFNKNELLEVSYGNRSTEFLKRPKRYDPLKKWNIRPIKIQLDIVLDRYHLASETMENIYFGVIGCGVRGCRNFPDFIPKPNLQPNTSIFNIRRRHIGKKVNQLLQIFHGGLQKIGSSYGAMIKYENSSGLYNERRADLLEDLKTGIKLLNLEVESALVLRNTEIVQIDEDLVYHVFPFPHNQTDLIIQEWYIIQGSKNFLTEWQKIFNDLEKKTMELRGSERRRSKKPTKSKDKCRKRAKMKKKKMRSSPRKS